MMRVPNWVFLLDLIRRRPGLTWRELREAFAGTIPKADLNYLLGLVNDPARVRQDAAGRNFVI